MKRADLLWVSEDGVAEQAKVSDMLLEFAQPLLQFDPGGPPNLEVARMIMQLAEICWNLPVMEADHAPEFAEVQRMFHASMATMPPALESVVRERMAARTSEYAGVPFYVGLRLTGESLADARLVAEARMPSSAWPPEGRTPRKAGRNDPCPCGSGRKFKKCCAN